MMPPDRGEPTVRPATPVMPAFAALVVAAALLLFWPVAAFVVYQDVDYNNHLSFLRQLMNDGSLRDFLAYYPHFVYHLLVYSVSHILPDGNFNVASHLVSVLFFVLAALAVYALLVRQAGRPATIITGALYAFSALALMLIMPFNLLTPNNLYLGYIVVHAYHNPTILAVKPFAALLFWFAGCALLSSEQPANRRVVVLTAALVSALSVLVKPSYTMALLPALALIGATRAVCRQGVDWVLVAAVMLPAVALMGLQWLLFTSTEGFVVAPLAVINYWAAAINPAANQNLALKLALSILFPAAIYLLYGRSAIRSVPLNLAWLTFAFGAAYMYLLAEGGAKLGHANFTWSAQAALFVLFAASLAFFIQQNRPLRLSARLLAGLGLLALHVISGLHWYQIHVNAHWMGDIITNLW